MIYDAVMGVIYRTAGGFIDLLPAAENVPSWVSNSFGYVYSMNDVLPIAMVSAYLAAWVTVETNLFIYKRVMMMWSRR